MMVPRYEPVTQLTPPQTLTSDVVCVLGMHRSGTSLLARLLNLLGVYLGPEHQLMEPNEYNPKGYWEHNEIMSLNDEILARFGGSWDEPPTFPPGWENDERVEDLKQQARTLIQETFADTEIWGWKDPRSSLTLPFWQQLLPQMRYVVCLRNPADVVHSLHYRDSFSAEKGSSLWVSYVNHALNYSDGYPRLIMFYEDLMDDWLQEIRRLAAFIGRPARAEDVTLQNAVREFIEEGLQHHRSSLMHTAANVRVSRRARALYIAERISVTSTRNLNKPDETDEQIEQAVEILSSSFKVPDQVGPLYEQLTKRDEQLAENQNTIRALNAQLVGVENDLKTASARLDEYIENLATLSSQHAEKDAMLQTLSAKLAEKDLELQTLSNQFTRMTEALQAISTQFAEKEASLERVQVQAAESEEKLSLLSAQLLDREAQLKAIKDSRVWRLRHSYLRVRTWLLRPVKPVDNGPER